MLRGLFLIMLLGITPGAQSEVRSATATDFAIHHEAVVKVDPATAYKLATQPARWWSGAHSWSGNAHNFRLEARAGGCWCEVWKGGSVAHGRVLMARPGQMLRVDAPFGPLMQMPVQAVFTLSFKPEGTGTRMSADYIAAGPASLSLDKLAIPVDQVIGEQFTRLTELASGS